ncbi:MAG: hypothetical protein BWK78_01865 [Thiotrichaceae bacterium IS1]|nr:MAG: hypothetical protein BWK78_01865 [Thiotrichaceae bacterium IS1]
MTSILGLFAWVILAIDLIAIILLFFNEDYFLFFKKDPHWKITAIVFGFSFIFLGFYGDIYTVVREMFFPPMVEGLPATEQVAGGSGWLPLSLILLVLLLFYWALRFAVGTVILWLERLIGKKTNGITPSSKKITIMLIGPESVGKTSVLATTYNAVANDCSIMEFAVRPQHDTMRVLSDAYGKLHKVTEQAVYQDLSPLIEGTQMMAERSFDVYLRDEHKLTLGFWDIPGGYMNIDGKHMEYKKFKDALAETTVFINVLDAVALIEGNEAYFHERATPLMAKYYLEEPLVKSAEKKYLVLFVVTKCEKWLRTEEGRRELREKFDLRYQDIINLVKSNGRMVGVLVPVKTLGCVEFTRIDSVTKRPIFERRPRVDCKPQFVDQPLRYALSFALSQLKIDSREQKKFPDKVHEFQRALEDLKGTRDKNLAVYGRKDLLG